MGAPPIVKQGNRTFYIPKMKVYKSSFRLGKRNISFSNQIPGYWQEPEPFRRLEILTEQGLLLDLKLHVEEQNRRRLELKIAIITLKFVILKIFQRGFKDFGTKEA